MTQATYRIPRLAAVALVFGGCGDDPEENSTTGVDVSASRVQKVAKAVCRHYAECDPEVFEQSYDSADECVAYYAEGVDHYVELSGEACADALLDWKECMATISCEESEGGGESCEVLDDKAAELCGEGEG